MSGRRRLPAGLGDAGQLAAVCHLAEAHTAQPEPAVHGTGAPTAVAPGVPTHLELGRPLRLRDQRLLRHGQLSLNGNPSRLSSERPSSSVAAVVVTTVMSIPRCLSTRSGLISWNMSCSFRPNV